VARKPKIRNYTVEERVQMDEISNSDWTTAFNKYLDDLSYPFDKSNRILTTDWLLSVAVRLEYGDNPDKFNRARDMSLQGDKPQVKINHVLENLDYKGEEFKNGVKKIQTLLGIPDKSNDILTVSKAVNKLISERLSADAVNAYLAVDRSKAKTKDQTQLLELKSMPLGFSINDYIVNEAAKILRLLHIQDLRDLQTKINETIVSIQLISANPKTDASLGKVGV